MLEKLRNWFLKSKRVFPWRENPTPYAVWISEIMLQQTQASVVVDYFHRWMERFPNIESVASASEDELIKQWEGLGYYSRVRNIQKTAKQLCKTNMPDSEEALLALPGIGAYTAGAILSFAYRKKGVALDGNVLRVMARFLKIEESIDLPKVKRKIYEAVYALLPDQEPHIIMEALIELGALICGKAPKCLLCPLQEKCLAWRAGKEKELPIRKVRPKTIHLMRSVVVIESKGKYLVMQNREKQIMEGLYEFPYFDKLTKIALNDQLRQWLLVDLHYCKKLPAIAHTFTRYKAKLFPTLWQIKQWVNIENYSWVPFEELKKLPFSSGHRKIMQGLINAHTTH